MEDLVMNSERKKDRILMVMNYLKDHTDESHEVTIPEILDYLQANGITTTRKGLYDDIRILNEQEFEVQKIRHHYYAHVGFAFDLFELNLLLDLVGSTRFIDAQQTDKLSAKIRHLGSKYQQSSLSKLHPLGKYSARKTELRDSLWTLYELHRAIAERHVVEFQYARSSYLEKTELVAKQQRIRVEPYSLYLHHDQYYWFGHPLDQSEDTVHIYRLSRIRHLKVLEDTQFFLPAKQPEFLPGSQFYEGPAILVQIETHLSILDRLYDVFGNGIHYETFSDQKIKVSIETNDSRGTVNSLIGFGSRIKVTSPESIIQQMRREIQLMHHQYESYNEEELNEGN